MDTDKFTIISFQLFYKDRSDVVDSYSEWFVEHVTTGFGDVISRDDVRVVESTTGQLQIQAAIPVFTRSKTRWQEFVDEIGREWGIHGSDVSIAFVDSTSECIVVQKWNTLPNGGKLQKEVSFAGLDHDSVEVDDVLISISK